MNAPHNTPQMTPQKADSETRFRLEAGLDKWLEVHAAKKGISKTKYIIQVLEAHKLGAKTPQDTPQETPQMLVRLAAIEDRLAKLEVKDSTNDSTKNSTKNVTSAVDVELVLDTPQDTPQDTLPTTSVVLTKQQFRKKFSLLGVDNNEAFGKVCTRARALGWKAPDKDKWFCSQDASKWSTDKAAVLE